MDDSNKKTIESYESATVQYVKNTSPKRSDDIILWIDKSLQSLNHDAEILEIGSASGVDAKSIEDKGYKVEKTDATQGFVTLLQKNDPTSRKLNVITDEINGSYDLIIANAVFLHFTESDTKVAIKKVYEALNTRGVFSLTLKEGEGESWQENKEMPARYFRYWTKEEIVSILTSAGFNSVDAWIVSSGSSSAKWIMIIAKKTR